MGSNIKTRDDVEVSKENIGYLPTINELSTKLSTVQEILRNCLDIRKQHDLDNIVCVAD